MNLPSNVVRVLFRHFEPHQSVVSLHRSRINSFIWLFNHFVQIVARFDHLILSVDDHKHCMIVSPDVISNGQPNHLPDLHVTAHLDHEEECVAPSFS